MPTVKGVIERANPGVRDMLGAKVLGTTAYAVRAEERGSRTHEGPQAAPNRV